MTNGNGEKSKWLLYVVSAFVSFAVLVGIAFANATNSRLEKADDERGLITTDVAVVQADIREIKTRLEYINIGMAEQKVVSQEILKEIKDLGK